MTTKLISEDLNSIVSVEAGELISYVKNGEELLHQIGSPGWKHTDTEMFPIVGGTVANNYSISTPKGVSFQDQHGLLREMNYEALHCTENEAFFVKHYKADTKIRNSKFPNNSTLEFMWWPYDFSFTKSFHLSNDFLEVRFEFESDEEMPFMLGYHPAFKLDGAKTEKFKVGDEVFSFESVMKVGDRAFPLLNCSEILMIKDTGYSIQIKTTGFDNFMLWSPVANMVCIEPISQYPSLEQAYSEKNMRILREKEVFSVKIVPISN